MGIKTAPAWFQRFMESTFRQFIDKQTLQVYLDDCISHTRTLVHHTAELFDVFKCIAKHNLKCSFDKSKLITNTVTFLGNVVSQGRIEPHPKRAICIKKRPKPATLQALQSWLGAANYQRSYIPHYAQVTDPLYKLVDQKALPNK